MATTPTQRTFGFDRTDLLTNKDNDDFLNSNDPVWIANYVMLKSDITELIIDLPNKDIKNNLTGVSQIHKKPNTLNIFDSTTRNALLNLGIEKGLFDKQNVDIYQHSELSDIYNRFENYMVDGTDNFIPYVDLSTILNQYETDLSISDILPETEGCFAKHFFNVYEIAEYSSYDESISYENALSQYQDGLNPYFTKQNEYLQSSFAINRRLYDTFYTNNRSSALFFDFSDTTNQASVSLYKIFVTSTYITIKLNEYRISYAFKHSKRYNSEDDVISIGNSSVTVQDYAQQNNSLTYVTQNQSGANQLLEPTLPADSEIVYSASPVKQYCRQDVSSSTQIALSTITDFSYVDIKTIELLESNQHECISEGIYSSLYTLFITTTTNKQIYIPFDVTYNSNLKTVSAKNVIDKTSCTLFEQNELNSSFNGVQEIKQDVFNITSILNDEIYNTNTNSILLPFESINICNLDVSIDIKSDTTRIIKIGSHFINDNVVIDRNLYQLKDPQNYTLLSIFDDLSNIDMDSVYHTPLGMFRDGKLNSYFWRTQTTNSSFRIKPTGRTTLFGGKQLYYDVTGSVTSYLSPQNIMNCFLNGTISATTSENLGDYQQFKHLLYNSISNTIYALRTDQQDSNQQAYLDFFQIIRLAHSGDGYSRKQYVGTINQNYQTYGRYIKFIVDSSNITFLGNYITNEYTDTILNTQSLPLNPTLSNFMNYTSKTITFSSSGYRSILGSKYSLGNIIDSSRLEVIDDLNNVYDVTCTTTLANGSQIYTDINKLTRFPLSEKFRDTTGRYVRTSQYNAYLAMENSASSTLRINHDQLTPFKGTQLMYGYGISYLNDTTLFQTYGYFSGSTPAGGFTMYEFLDKTIVTTSYSKYQISQMDNTALFLFGIPSSQKNFYKFNIESKTIELLAPKPTNFYSIMVQRYIDGVYWIIGVDQTDIYTRYLYKMSYASTTQNILAKYELKNFTPTWLIYVGLVYPNDFAYSGFNALQVVNDTTFFGVSGTAYGTDSMHSSSHTFHFTLGDSSIVYCSDVTNSNAENPPWVWSTSQPTMEIEDEENQDHKLHTNVWVQQGFTPNKIIRDVNGSPFELSYYNKKIRRLVFKKQWDEPYFEYVKSAFYTPSGTTYYNFGARNGYNLFDSSGYYANVCSSFSIRYHKTENFPKTGMAANSIFTLKPIYANHPNTITQFGYKINNEIISSTYDSYVGYQQVGYTADATNNRFIQLNKKNIGSLSEKYETYSYFGTRSAVGGKSVIDFSQKSGDIINIMDRGCVYKYNTITDSMDIINIHKFDSTYSNYFTAQALNNSKYVFAYGRIYSDGTTKELPYIYSIKRNQWYHIPYVLKNNYIGTQYPVASVYCEDDYVTLFAYTTSGSGGNYNLKAGMQSANFDSCILNRTTIFCPVPPDSTLQSSYTPSNHMFYYDDLSNMLQKDSIDSYIVTKPKFYTNVFSTDLCPSTFNEYISSVHKCTDNTRQLLGAGMQFFTDQYDKILIYKWLTDSSSVLRIPQINGELSLNNSQLKQFQHNISSFGHTYNNDSNSIYGGVSVRCDTDFTLTSYTTTAQPTCHFTGNLNVDQTYTYTISTKQMVCDISTLSITSGSYTIDKTVRETIPISTDITMKNYNNFQYQPTYAIGAYVESVNDYFIRIQVQQTEYVGGAFYIVNPINTFTLFNNNKTSWMANVAFYNDYMYVLMPYHKKLCKYYTGTYNGSETYDTTLSNEYWYYNPIALGTNVMQLYSDLSSSLVSISTTTGLKIQEYNNLKIRFKKNYDDTVFMIYYDETYADEFIRKTALLRTDGTLYLLNTVDIITQYILDNRQYDTTSIVITNNDKYISIEKDAYIVENIFIGNKNHFKRMNQYYEDSDLLYINITVRNIRAHTDDIKIIVVNKNNQQYYIDNNIIQNTVDSSDLINTSNVLDSILKYSNDIIRVHDESNNPFKSKLLSQYSCDDNCIKYLDIKYGFIYKIEDIKVYNGVFFYKNSSLDNTSKEFAIWDKMHTSLQYHDILPNIEFTSYGKNANYLCNYVYDSSRVYFFLDMQKGVKQAKLKIKVVSYIDINQRLSEYIDNTYLGGSFVDETVISYNGLFPYSSIVFERINKFAERVYQNRFVKITTDFTFIDMTDILSADNTSTTQNPFGSFELWIKYHASSSISTNYINMSTPTNAFNTAIFSANPIYDAKLEQTLCTTPVETNYYITPTNNTYNGFTLSFKHCGNYGMSGYSNQNITPLDYQKFYYARIAGKITIRYNKNVYRIVNLINIDKDNTDYTSYGFDTYDTTIKPLDYLVVTYTPNSKKLYDWLSLYTDGYYNYRKHSAQTLSVVSSTQYRKYFRDHSIYDYNIGLSYPTSAIALNSQDTSIFCYANYIYYSEMYNNAKTLMVKFDDSLTGITGIVVRCKGRTFETIDGRWQAPIVRIILRNAANVQIQSNTATYQSSSTFTGYMHTTYASIVQMEIPQVFLPSIKSIELIFGTWVANSDMAYSGGWQLDGVDFYTGDSTYSNPSISRHLAITDNQLSIISNNSTDFFINSGHRDYKYNNRLYNQQLLLGRAATTYSIRANTFGFPNDASNDSTIFLLGLDGTYDVTKVVYNSNKEFKIDIPENASMIKISNIKPENYHSIPIISVKTDSTGILSEQSIPTDIEFEIDLKRG